MPVGQVGTQSFDTAGFTVTNSIKLLGTTITNDLDNTDEFSWNWEKKTKHYTFLDEVQTYAYLGLAVGLPFSKLYWSRR
jgi:hypothetical protein